MRHSRICLFVHVVWATAHRAPLLVEPIRRVALRAIDAEVRRLDVHIVALDGGDDHVHILVGLPSTLSLAELVNRAKGVSSRIVSQAFPDDHAFGWQKGYGAFSVSRHEVDRVCCYIQNHSPSRAAFAAAGR